MRLVEQTRARGYAFNDGLIVPAMNAIAVPVCDAEGRPLFALSLAAIRDRMGPDRLDGLIDHLKNEAADLERRLPPPVAQIRQGGNR